MATSSFTGSASATNPHRHARASHWAARAREAWLELARANEGSPPRNTDRRDGQSGYRFLAQSSCCNLKAEFNSQDKGKTAYYALQRVSTRSGKKAVEPGGDGSGVMLRTS